MTRQNIFFVVLFLAAIAGIAYFGNYFKAVFTSADAVRAWVLQYGSWAPLATIFIEAVQVIVAPLNNFFVNFASGYIFGPYAGFFYSYVGWIAGAIAVFWLCRLFGRRFVDVFVRPEKLARFDDIIEKGTYIIFMLLLLPGPPDDFIVYLLGLSKATSFRTFLWMVFVSKFPGKLATSFLGAGVADHSTISFAIYGIFIAGSLVIFWKKPELWKLWRKTQPELPRTPG
ncbi:MAG: TVP38/TMEM64 family protein [Parcubacteria group bacterium]|nr:TVP38/TMEM64 family protein [Parcubacteria group bacterium]